MVNNTIEFEVWGDRALFTDPVTKPTGEKMSYPVPTYSALRGVCQSIFWKPAITYKILKVRVMNEITRDRLPVIYPDLLSSSPNPIKIMGEEQYLVNPRYQIQAKFVANPLYSAEEEVDIDGIKYHFGFDGNNTAKYRAQIDRYIKRSGRKNIFLGTSDCPAFVKPCYFGEGEGYYDSIPKIDIGEMVLGFIYPDENLTGYIQSYVGNVVMRHGVIELEDPVAVPDSRKWNVSKMSPHKFMNNRKGEGCDAWC